MSLRRDFGWLWRAYAVSSLGTWLALLAVPLGPWVEFQRKRPLMIRADLVRTEDSKVARVLTAWTITTRTAIAATTAIWGLLASFTSARTAIGIAGVLLLGTSLLLPLRITKRRRSALSAAEAPASPVPNAPRQ